MYRWREYMYLCRVMTCRRPGDDRDGCPDWGVGRDADHCGLDSDVPDAIRDDGMEEA